MIKSCFTLSEYDLGYILSIVAYWIKAFIVNHEV